MIFFETNKNIIFFQMGSNQEEEEALKDDKVLKTKLYKYG